MQINIARKDSVHVVALRKVTTKKEVWNISVEDCHEYFANGVLTHNCDSVLYASRRVFNHLGINPKERAQYGSKEWAKEEEQRIIENEIRIAKERDEQDDYLNYN